MTAIRGYVAPTTESDALGVHSLDQFVLAVPDVHVAQEFYGNFGLDLARDGNTLAARLVRLGGKILFQGALNIQRMRVLALDAIGVIRIHAAQQLRQPRLGRRMHPAPQGKRARHHLSSQDQQATVHRRRGKYRRRTHRQCHA